MNTGSLHLFDDRRARQWSPFSLTRPVGELLHGCMLQRERASSCFRLPCAGHLTSEALRGFREEGVPPVRTESEDLPEDTTRVLLSSRAVPEGDAPELETSRARLVMDGNTVGWVVPPGEPLPPEAWILDPDGSGTGNERMVELPGRILGWPWDLVDGNAEQLVRDITRLHRGGDSFLLTGVETLGDHTVSLGAGAKVEPGVILDLRDGPIRLEPGARVQGPARLVGPLWVGPGSTILGGSLEHVSIGPVCKVRGEVEASVFLGYDNKAHDGYLGHAYLGRWVNLGALTTNSDLKNSYSGVRVTLAPDRTEETGLLKVGAFLGDHVKTGIGTLLNTGAVLGAGSNVFGGGILPGYIPPFAWGTGTDLGEYRLDKFLEVAEAAMGRRDVDLGVEMRDLLSRAWEGSRDLREQSSSRSED